MILEKAHHGICPTMDSLMSQCSVGYGLALRIVIALDVRREIMGFQIRIVGCRGGGTGTQAGTWISHWGEGTGT